MLASCGAARIWVKAFNYTYQGVRVRQRVYVFFFFFFVIAFIRHVAVGAGEA